MSPCCLLSCRRKRLLGDAERWGLCVCCSPCLTSSDYRILFMKLFTSVFRSQHAEAPTSVLLSALAFPYGEKGGWFLGKLPALGQLWKQLGFVPALWREGKLRAGTVSASGRGWCSLSPSSTSCGCPCFRRKAALNRAVVKQETRSEGWYRLLMAFW